jgi:hypothetical protein
MTHNRGFPFLLIAVAMLATIAPGYAQSRPSDAEIATLLRAGGHVIVIRHGATHPDQADTDPLNTDNNIAKQRQLNPKGEEAAKALGTSPASAHHRVASPSKGIGAKLQLHDLARRPLAALDVERSSGAIRRPHRLALPAGICIVEAAIHPLGIKAHGIGHAQIDELSVHQGEERLVGVAGGDRHILAQTERVELVYPGVVARQAP